MAKVKKRSWKNKDGTKTQIWYLDYKDAFGNRKREGSYRIKADAEAALSKIQNDINTGNGFTQDKNKTFGEAAQSFLDLHASLHCKPSTYNGYANYIKIHLNPFFGKMKLIDIIPNSINLFIKKKQESGLSNNTINKMLILMGSVYQHMLDNGIVFQNPLRRVKKLKVETVEMRFLETKEIPVVLDTAKKYYPDFYPLLLTAILTGMRRGEILGLTWDKVNWVTKKIYVKQSLYKGKIITPKTKTSVRKIDMADELVRVLREWKLRCPITKEDFVFPSPEGSIPDPDNFIKRRFDPVIRRAGIDKIRFHDLRHTYASVLIAKNVPIKYIMNQMGHSSSQVTLDRYGHLMPEVHEKGVEALNSLFLADNYKNNLVAVL